MKFATRARFFLERSADVNPETGLPPRVVQPKADWFDPDTPAKAELESDWLLEIYEDRFVAVIYSAKQEPVIFGDLRKEATYFVAWIPFLKRVPLDGDASSKQFAKELPPENLDFIVEWEEPTKSADQFKLLHYRYEKHDRDDDPLRMAAGEVRPQSAL